MTWELALLCLAALAAGAVNSVAGGGTLLTFPVLVAALTHLYGNQADAVASQTSTVALVPGSFVAAFGYRKQLAGAKHWLRVLFLPSLVGGVIGAILLRTFPVAFKSLVPWLILSAALLFALQPQIVKWTGIGHAHAPTTKARLALVILFQLLVAIYGGYFGAGIGILMLSALAMIGLSDIHEMNALKNVLAAIINGVTAIVFIFWGTVEWRFALPMLVASIVGGYGGAAVALRINRTLVRRVVVLIGFGLAIYYFWRLFR